jgi:hypothetical protein
MGDERADRRKRLQEELAKLREAALAELERCGYDVRGKTTSDKANVRARPHETKRHEGR